MRLIEIRRTDEGFYIDPSRYLNQLGEISAQLPPGAAAFARDPGHYEFRDRCMKDLHPTSVSIEMGSGSSTSTFIYSTPGKVRRPMLCIQYRDISDIRIRSHEGTEAAGRETKKLGSVLLDELLPAEYGCTHEIICIFGSIFVSCADLEFQWIT